MRIIVFTHPKFINSNSMPRFARMIVDGMKLRGHTVEEWSAKPYFYKLPLSGTVMKWLGYIDQYLVFPIVILGRLFCGNHKDAVFVFTDQALGPWVPLVKKYPHIIHVHDFMAYHSSLGAHPENPTSRTGKLYQKFIKNGFSKGKCFISVSKNTKAELDKILNWDGEHSFVVYNGLNPIFRRIEKSKAVSLLQDKLPLPVLSEGFLLHVGGNQWYKNRNGVLEIYAAYARQAPAESCLPLVMIGANPTASLTALANNLPEWAKVYFISGVSDEQVCAAYSLASLFLFPSLEEGFGWPIAEAMACGCPVVTTNKAPMTEVGGTAAIYIERRTPENAVEWAEQSATRILELLADESSMQTHQTNGIERVREFDAQSTLDAYEKIYMSTLNGIEK